MSNPTTGCSFCGKPSADARQLFRPEGDSQATAAGICDECVLTCAKAVDVEQRLSQRPESRSESQPDSDRQGSGAVWLPFTVGSLSLEWRAEPAMLVSVRRQDDHERVVTEHFGRDTEPSIDDAESVVEDHWHTLHD